MVTAPDRPVANMFRISQALPAAILFRIGGTAGGHEVLGQPALTGKLRFEKGLVLRMSNTMECDFEFFIDKKTDSNTMNILEFLLNDKSLSFHIPDEDYFKCDEWERLFDRYNGYPEFEKCFINDNDQPFVKVVIENREEKYELLEKFFEWIIPYIDVEKNKSDVIGNFKCDSSFDFMKLKIDSEKNLLIREIIDPFGGAFERLY